MERVRCGNYAFSSDFSQKMRRVYAAGTPTEMLWWARWADGSADSEFNLERENALRWLAADMRHKASDVEVQRRTADATREARLCRRSPLRRGDVEIADEFAVDGFQYPPAVEDGDAIDVRAACDRILRRDFVFIRGPGGGVSRLRHRRTGMSLAAYQPKEQP